MGIDRPLLGRNKRKIKDKLEKLCGFVLLGRKNRNKIELTTYNVPQDTPSGNNKLYTHKKHHYACLKKNQI